MKGKGGGVKKLGFEVYDSPATRTDVKKTWL
jgi:hypothetical protein